MATPAGIAGRLLLLAGILLAAQALTPARAQEQGEPLSYLSDMFNCDWLAKEYQRIIDANATPPQIRGLGSAPLLVAPFILIEKLLGMDYVPPEAAPINGTVAFSGAVEDIAVAARDKNCYQLYDRFVQDRRNGELDGVAPAPARSYLPAFVEDS